LRSDASVSLIWGDYDNDGDLDQLVGNSASKSNRVFSNNGDGSFAIRWNSAEAETSAQVAWGDYDNDGDLDQLVANGVNVNRIYNNDGNNTFTIGWNSVENEGSTFAAWGDYDNDGNLDQLVANSTNKSNRVYRNEHVENGLIGNQAPSAPSSGFSSTFLSNIGPLQMRWDAGTDMKTPTNGLYYQVMVATDTMAGDDNQSYIVSPTIGAGASPLMGNYSHGFVTSELQPGFDLMSVVPGLTYLLESENDRRSAHGRSSPSGS